MENLEEKQPWKIIPLFGRKGEKNFREGFVFLEWVKLVLENASWSLYDHS